MWGKVFFSQDIDGEGWWTSHGECGWICKPNLYSGAEVLNWVGGWLVEGGVMYLLTGP